MSSRPPSFPLSWPFCVLLLVLVLVAATVAGCTGSPDRDGPGDEDTGDPSDGQGPIDPLGTGTLVPEEIEPAVHELAQGAGAGEGAFGYVFDEETRETVPGAKVVAQCHLEGLELPVSPRVVEADEEGRFAFVAGGTLSSCDFVGYQALHPGLLQETQLTGPPLIPGAAYLVLIGLQPAA